MTADHKAALELCCYIRENEAYATSGEETLAAAYLELRELAKEFYKAMTALYPTHEEGRYMQDRWAERRQKAGEALRAAIGEE